MRRAVLADLHLGQAPGDKKRFTHLVEELEEARVGEVIFGGDVFRTLVGYPRFWHGEIRENLVLLARLRERGIRVVWVEGNRDFFVGVPAMDLYRDRWVLAYGFSAGGRRFLVEHGDLVNRRDYQYRFWRSLSKSRLASFFARILPVLFARKLVGSTERVLSRTNLANKRVLPMEALLAAARAHFAAGVDVVLWGHFHQPWSFNDGPKEAHVLPPWLETGVVVYIEEDGSFYFRQNAGQFVDKSEGFCYQAQEVAR